MIKTVCLTFIFSLCLLSANGQGKESLKQRINEIKQENELYYWNQYTGYNGDTAKVNATKWLLLEINSGRPEHEKLTVAEAMQYAKYISIDRGNAVQYFVYITKAEADKIKRSGSAPASHGMISVVDGEANPAETAYNAEAAPSQPLPKRFVPDTFVQRIMDTEKFMDVYQLLKSLKAQGTVLMFGKLRDVEDYSSLDLILFDMQSQEIVTLLSAETSPGVRTNLVSGNDDALSNYPTEMTAVIWYIKK